MEAALACPAENGINAGKSSQCGYPCFRKQVDSGNAMF
jgi:hypothetical protein